MQALGWFVDERGLAGMAQSDGLAWSLPMHELFERWVEHLVRFWARGIGAQVRSGRTYETLVPIRWTRAEARSLNSLIPDLIVQRGQSTPGSLMPNTKAISKSSTSSAGSNLPKSSARNTGTIYIKSWLMLPSLAENK